jgi:hypothetical protein
MGMGQYKHPSFYIKGEQVQVVEVLDGLATVRHMNGSVCGPAIPVDYLSIEEPPPTEA